MNLIYYYKINNKTYGKIVKCKIESLHNKIMNLKYPIINISINIAIKNNLSNSDMDIKTYKYNKQDGIFYIPTKEKSDIILNDAVRMHLSNILE
jgi:hypothetical protein